jgi:hypothetical protein
MAAAKELGTAMLSGRAPKRAKNKTQAEPHERWRPTLSTRRTPATPATKRQIK